MHSSVMNGRAKHRLDISDIGPRFSSTKPAGAISRGVLALAVLSALLLIAARPSQAQTETVLYNFLPSSNSGGAQPESHLTSDGTGNFYGTTYEGGLGYGTVFELSPNGSGGWNENTLYSFCSQGGESCTDGMSPYLSYVIFDSVGNLYGTTEGGGPNGGGVVFELSPVGTSWTETVLYGFTSGENGYPVNGLIFDPAGNLYGTTYWNDTPDGGGIFGTVFELSPSGAEQVIYKLGSEAGLAGLTMDSSGNIFGVGYSIVFELSPNGNGVWNPGTVIHSFTGAPKDGVNALGTPVLDNAGNLYGTTAGGGAENHGTVYKLSPGTKGKWTEKILYSFKGSPKDGNYPWAGIVFDAVGNIYGTTSAGGGEGGYGTVYELVAPVGKGSYKEKVLWSFNVTDGWYLLDSLILDSAGNLYGTAGGGGSNGAGVVFEVNPSPDATTIALTSSPNPSTYGQAVTFTAVLAPAPPDGETVSFMKGKAVLGTGTLSSGSANFTTSTLKVGTTIVRAVYGGDFEFLGSTSNTVKQVVEKAAN